MGEEKKPSRELRLPPSTHQKSEHDRCYFLHGNFSLSDSKAQQKHRSKYIFNLSKFVIFGTRHIVIESQSSH